MPRRRARRQPRILLGLLLLLASLQQVGSWACSRTAAYEWFGADCAYEGCADRPCSNGDHNRGFCSNGTWAYMCRWNDECGYDDRDPSPAVNPDYKRCPDPQPCDAGSYSPTGMKYLGDGACKHCEAGKYSSSSGATSCLPCPSGTWSTTGSASASDCTAPDTFPQSTPTTSSGSTLCPSFPSNASCILLMLYPPGGHSTHSDFGASVSIGAGFAAVGAPSAETAFVYQTRPPSAEAIASLTAPDAVAGDSFGKSVSVSKGGEWIAVGAPHRDEGGTSNRGAVYVFRYTGGLWSYHSKITSTLAAANDRFGWSVSIDDSPSNNGAVRVLVGCNYHTDYSGFVEVFEMPAGKLAQAVRCRFAGQLKRADLECVSGRWWELVSDVEQHHRRARGYVRLQRVFEWRHSGGGLTKRQL